MNISDPEFAVALRDEIRRIIREELRSIFPPAALGTVTDLDTVNKIAMVNFPPDTTSVPVSYPASATPVVGSTVRVMGERTKRFIVSVI